MSATRVVLVEDDESTQLLVRRFVLPLGCDLEVFSLGQAAWDYLSSCPLADCLILDIRLPDSDGLGLFRRIQQVLPALPIILITGFGNTDQAVQAMKEGAYYYYTKPLDYLLLKRTVADVLEKAQLKRHIDSLQKENYGLIGDSSPIRDIIERIRLVADLSTTVLISGETGTGKELVARAIHNAGSRRHHPFVIVNCAAVPADLLESELFGHERGAFTGAVQTKPGRLETADQGTLLLDEISELSLALQPKLLRVIESKELERVGSVRSRSLDVRFLAATNRNLEKAVESGQFRQDLFFRLNAFRIDLSPLRKRPDDIPLLVTHFLEQLNRSCHRAIESVAPEVLEAFRTYDWPGNVRELRYVLESAAICCPSDRIELRHLPAKAGWSTAESDGPSRLRELERMAVRDALRRTQGNQSAAARLLGISRNQLRYKVKRYGLDAEDAEEGTFIPPP